MGTGEMPVEQTPPASRQGMILGWDLLALGVACFIASVVFIIQANALSDAVDRTEAAWNDAIFAHPDHMAAAYAAYSAAKAVYHEATLRECLFWIAAWLSLSIVPGLLYALKPSLLGGPFGRLLRRITLIAAPKWPRRRRPIWFYPGLGVALQGIGWSLPFLAWRVSPLISVPLWAILLPSFSSFILIVMGYPLLAGGWWFQPTKD